MLKRLKIYCRSSQHLEAEQFDQFLFQFIQKRLEHFFSDYSLGFQQMGADDDEKLIANAEDPEQIMVITPLINPLLDLPLLRTMIEEAAARNVRIEAKGAVPGTAVSLVSKAGVFGDGSKTYYVHSVLQRKYNSQLNLARLRRVKIFRALVEKIADLHLKSVEDILDFFSGKEGTEFILAYGEDVRLEYLEACPLCGAKEGSEKVPSTALSEKSDPLVQASTLRSDFSCRLVSGTFSEPPKATSPVYADVSQPLTGFLTRFSEYYFLCHECGLVFVNPRMPEKELWRYYDRYSYDASEWTDETLRVHYENLNHLNTSHFYNYVAALPYIKKLSSNAKVLDLGGGDGEFVVFLRQNFPDFQIMLWDYRISPLIENGLAPFRIDMKQSDFLNESFGNVELDLVTNWEVIEHLPLEKLEDYFNKIYKSLKEGGIYVFSTPDFDNPYCHALDFWAITPGEHISIFSRKVLEPILAKCGFKIIAEHHECVGMKTKDRWYKYGAECSSSMAARAEAEIINDFLKNEAVLDQHLDWLRRNNLGSELILCCQK
ncbi:class I SAM-dependent methyltransferase [Candidatus Peregrinibacteria bacterium]|nr:class I SAM-dependent methyltransferase [Candidatus Peregrinibacteria bacterium]